MGRNRLFRRARPASLLAALALLSSLCVPLLHAPAASAAAPPPSATPATPGSARGDFNHDGYADLAISVPLWSDAFSMQGAVQIIYGGPNGLDPVASPGHPGEQFITEANPGESFGFGISLAVGDFNGDGYGDLAVGANGEDIGVNGNNEGTVTVFYGSANGLVTSTSQGLTEATPTAGNQLGFTLAAGDFNGDHKDDLAVDVLNATVDGVKNAGAVLIYPGSAAGLDASHAVQLDADKPPVHRATDGAQFGSVLAVGDVNLDGRADLAVSAPGDTVKGQAKAGAVHLFYGCSSGATCNLVDTATEQYITQGTHGTKGIPEVNDFFGLALAMGDFGRSPGADLAVGVPGEDFKGVVDAGVVQVFYSNGSKLSLNTDQFLNQGGSIRGLAVTGDEFGAVLAAGNIGNGPQADLVIGVPFKTITTLANAGAVYVVYGGPKGLKTSTAEFITQGSSPIRGSVTAGDYFGKGLTVANLGFTAEGDLAITSRDTVNGKAAAGAVTVLYGGPGPISGATHVQYWTQDSPGLSHGAQAGALFGGVYGQPGLAG